LPKTILVGLVIAETIDLYVRGCFLGLDTF
jgi:hypothetical protein